MKKSLFLTSALIGISALANNTIAAISAPSGPGAVAVFGACMLLICD